MAVDELGHDGNGDCPRTLSKDGCYLLVLQTNHILSIYFGHAMISKDAVPESGMETD